MRTEVQRTNYIDPYLFKLLSRIKNEIASPRPAYEMTEDEIINMVTDQIKEVGDRLNLPIFRIENRFVLYEKDQPIIIPNRSLEKFLLIVCTHLGVETEMMDRIPFRNQLFGRLWKILVPEK